MWQKDIDKNEWLYYHVYLGHFQSSRELPELPEIPRFFSFLEKLKHFSLLKV